MVKLKVNIYDEFAGDLTIGVDVLRAEVSAVMYNNDELAVRLGLEEVPDFIDKDVRERAVEAFIDYHEERLGCDGISPTEMEKAFQIRRNMPR